MYTLNEIQIALLTSLLEKQDRVNREIQQQIAELIGLLRAAVGAPADWQLKGNPQLGRWEFAPPGAEVKVEDEQADAQEGSE